MANQTEIMPVLSSYASEISKTHDLMFVALYGSQNYHMDNADSDIDAYAVVIPSKRDLIYGKKTNRKLETRHGIVTVKTIDDMLRMYSKQSINFLETLFTPYLVFANEYQREVLSLRSHATEISNIDMTQQLTTTRGYLTGQCIEAQKKVNEDETRARKCLARALQLQHFMDLRILGQDFMSALDKSKYDMPTRTIIDRVKDGSIRAENIAGIAEQTIDRANKSLDSFESVNKSDALQKKLVLERKLADIAMSAINK